jgi:hypothetical protein
MKKGKVFFHPIDGSGSLTISWGSEPKGDAIEAKKGSGVGFFSQKKDLICVIFDEVKSNHDHQILEFERYRIEITIKHGQVEYSVTQHNATPRLRRRSLRRKQNI